VIVFWYTKITRQRAPKIRLNMKNTRVQHLVEVITAAIVGRRLPPGTRLPERELGDIFGVSRTLVRAAVAELKTLGLVEATGPKTTAVAQPSMEDAKALFGSMQVLESGAVQRLSGHLQARQIARLRKHAEREIQAQHRQDWLQANALGRGFHTLLIAQLGNPLLSQVFEGLLTREAVISAIYDTAFDYDHLHDEHVALVDHLETGRTAEALALVEDHWTLVIKGYRIETAAPAAADLRTMLLSG
jgi:DNA-binding GntR family transcriptional regulator